jgi:hypothetical protein
VRSTNREFPLHAVSPVILSNVLVFALENAGSISYSNKRFSVLQNTNAISGVHPNFHVNGIGNPFVGVKRREREADHSHSSSDVV